MLVRRSRHARLRVTMAWTAGQVVTASIRGRDARVTGDERH